MSHPTNYEAEIERSYLIKLTLDSTLGEGEDLDIRQKASKDPEVVNMRSEWILRALKKAYRKKFERSILIEFGNGIRSGERTKILKDVFYDLYDTKTAYARSFNYRIRPGRIQILISMRPEKTEKD
jgi:hypothetical protein